MRKQMKLASAGVIAIALSLGACSGADESAQVDAVGDEASVTASQDATVAKIPDSLAPFGRGYPDPGDPCRTLGESPATADYLDDSDILVGCPNAALAQALGGEVVTEIDGVTLVSIPTGNANPGLAEGRAPGPDDVLVAGTDYNATTILDCGFGNQPPRQSCQAGVKRNWGDTPGEHLVEVTKPDGRKRAIFFKGTTPYGADSAQADGSAGWEFETSRKGDQVTVNFGPETYVIVDALIEGG